MPSLRRLLTHERLNGFLDLAKNAGDNTAKGATVVAAFVPAVGIPAGLVGGAVSFTATAFKTLCEGIKDPDNLEESFATLYVLLLIRAFGKAVVTTIDQDQLPEPKTLEEGDTDLDLQAEIHYLLKQGAFGEAPLYQLLERHLTQVLTTSNLADDPTAFITVLGRVRRATQTQFDLLIGEQGEWIDRFLQAQERRHAAQHRLELNDQLDGIDDKIDAVQSLLRRDPTGTVGKPNPTARSVAERLAHITTDATTTPCAVAYAVTNDTLLTVRAPLIDANGRERVNLTAVFLRDGCPHSVPVSITRECTDSGAVLLTLQGDARFQREDNTCWLLPGTGASQPRLTFNCVSLTSDGAPHIRYEGGLHTGPEAATGCLNWLDPQQGAAPLDGVHAGAPCFNDGRLLGLFPDHGQNEPNALIPLTPLLTDPECCNHTRLQAIPQPGKHHQILTVAFFRDAPRRAANRKKFYDYLAQLPPAKRMILAKTIPEWGGTFDVKPDQTPAPTALGEALLAMACGDAVSACNTSLTHDKAVPPLRDSPLHQVWLGILQILLLHDLHPDWEGLLDQLEETEQAGRYDGTPPATNQPQRQLYMLKIALLNAARNNTDLRLKLTPIKKKDNDSDTEDNKAEEERVVLPRDGVVLSYFNEVELERGKRNQKERQNQVLERLLYEIHTLVYPNQTYDPKKENWIKATMTEKDYTDARDHFKRVARRLSIDQRVVPFILFDIAQGCFDADGLRIIKRILTDIPVYQDQGGLHAHTVLKSSHGAVAAEVMSFLTALEPPAKEFSREPAHS